jgi:hypothetical protein
MELSVRNTKQAQIFLSKTVTSLEAIFHAGELGNSKPESLLVREWVGGDICRNEVGLPTVTCSTGGYSSKFDWCLF